MLFNPDNEYISRCLVVFCFPGFKLLLKIVLYYYLINVINQTVLCFLWRVIAVFVFYYLRKIGCCFLLLNCYHAPFVRFVVSSGLIIFKCRSCVCRDGVGQMKRAGAFFCVEPSALNATLKFLLTIRTRIRANYCLLFCKINILSFSIVAAFPTKNLDVGWI